jgi:hypothetical protein
LSAGNERSNPWERQIPFPKEKQMGIIKWLQGRKTFITAIVGGVLGIVQAVAPEFQVPEYVWVILASLGLGFLRAGVNK